MEIKTNVAAELKLANELLEKLYCIETAAERAKDNIAFYTTRDVADMTGLSMPKVLEIFNRPDFPVCDYGHGKIVFAPAFYEYFMKAVKRNDFEV